MDPKLAVMSSQARRRWKVGRLYLSFESKTVWAHTAEDAAQEVMMGDGAAAEVWGPTPAAIAVAEMGTEEATTMQQEAKGWLRPPEGADDSI